MPSSSSGDEPDAAKPLDFERADFTGQPAGQCVACHQPVATAYYEWKGQTLCMACGLKFLEGRASGQSPASLMQAALFGLLAAVLGAGIYFAVAWLTGYQFGLIAVLVGYLVGSAVRRGSGGLGGPACQVLALVLTYAAIVATYVPGSGANWTDPSQLAQLLLLPLQEGSRSLIGLFIIGIALYEAWRLNQPSGMKVTGPYQVGLH